FELRRYGSGKAARRQRMCEVHFKRACCGFEADIRSSVVKGTAVWPDMGNYDVVMRIDVASSAGLAGMLPDDMRVVLRPHCREDPRDRFLALLVGQRSGGGKGEVMKCHLRPAAVPQRLHVCQGIRLVGHRSDDSEDARGLPILPRQMGKQIARIPLGPAVPSR